MPKRHGCASIMVLGRFKRRREAGGRWSLKLQKHITNKQRIGENEYESDTNWKMRAGPREGSFSAQLSLDAWVGRFRNGRRNGRQGNAIQTRRRSICAGKRWGIC